MKNKLFLVAFFFLGFPFKSQTQQIPDTLFYKTIQSKEYDFQKGSLIYVDEGHHNFHTKDGRYKPFAQVLEKDGYVVKKYAGAFIKKNLKEAKILVISNALNKINQRKWSLPTPSAFSEDEIKVLEQWVRQGGSLLLIADHMPFPGAAKELAEVFGFEFYNGFAIDTLGSKTNRGDYLFFFNRKEKSLHNNIITDGRNKKEHINEIVTFTGQAFKIPDDAQSILSFDERHIILMPEIAWQFHAQTPRIKIKDWSQGAYKKYGKGKVAVFGEASLFTAQLKGATKEKMGMNSKLAPENYKLLLNTIHWLDGVLE